MILPVPDGYAAIVAYFGDPKFDGNTVDAAWESASMTIARDLPGWPKLYLHRKIWEPLHAALSACAALADGYAIQRLGCFAPRFQRGSSSLVSVHTFGAAADLNPDTNGLIICDADDPRRTDPANSDIPPAWIAAFEAQGFFWGGRFKHRFDPMHFQWCTGF